MNYGELPYHPSERPLLLPPLRPRMDTVYVAGARYHLFYVPEILPFSLVRSTTTDFRISLYSSTHVFYFLQGIFYFPVVVKHSTLFIYTRYIIPYVLEYYNFIHTWYIYTWYIRTAVYVVPWYHTTYDMIFTNYQVLYLFSVRQTYTWY